MVVGLGNRNTGVVGSNSGSKAGWQLVTTAGRSPRQRTVSAAYRTVPPGKQPELTRLIASGKIKASRVGEVTGGRAVIELVRPDGTQMNLATYGWEHR